MMNGGQLPTGGCGPRNGSYVRASGQITYVVGPSEFVVRAFRLPY
jgi:hypothetical protein